MSKQRHPHELTKVTDIQRFMLGGDARLTLVSKKTKERFTYRVRMPKPKEDNDTRARPFFVSAMTGKDNETGYTYFGLVRGPDHQFEFARKAKLPSTEGCVKAFEWFFNNIMRANHMPTQLEVWHEGRCGKCGKPLTVPKSIECGFGPECQKRMGIE